MRGRVILYGASGYTGRMIAAQLDEVDELVVAGRNAAKVEAVAQPLDREWCSFDLSDRAETVFALSGADIMLNAAGPFDRTAMPLIDACLATGTHYLDLGGEWPVFIDIMARDEEARAAGIMLLPGVGLTIAATDCLLLRAVELWPDTAQLDLGVSRAQVVSRGSATSMSGLVAPTALICRDGELCEVPSGSLAKAFDFGEGMSEAVAMSWADVVTGHFTTGVPNVTVYNEMRWHERATYRGTGLGMGFTGRNAFRAVGGLITRALREGPPEVARGSARFSMVVEALDPWRRPRLLRLETLDGYGASARIAEEVVRRVLAGESQPGFNTPARLMGSSLVETSGAGEFETLSGRSAA
ncbi:saccharopine dehydrogenase family protein [Qipengyuania soli]|uniref:Saccharopine dehydrogenase NADP-binding domain-containing protein n=1 Tax=Qipengyuania soli TaxID=2782568 RepID=A0A7S8IUK8_9SPHN|nr:saccharopine dehydrogenase NADP-binding domain-containing protein [Qipengyuania soli]QPC99124.1 saccharopine dehydrogenase NADP-binding domain-containing protein [Qipengyuania soli]